MNNIEIHGYEPKYRDEWEKFVKNSNNGTMFHLLAFLDYHEKSKFKFNHLMIRRNGKLIGLLPGGITDDGKIFWSPVGASYGSVVTDDISFDVSLQLVDSLMEYFKEQDFKEIFMIPPPLIYSKNYSQNLEYAMLYRKFDFELHYISHAIQLKHGNEFLEHFDKTARKTIHKLLRTGELVISESDDYKSFNEILIANKAKHGVKPTHSLEDMKRLAELVPENLKLLMVYHDGKPIAGSFLFLCNSKVVLCFYNMLLYEYEHLKPIYLVMHETCRWACENGYEWVDIGVSQDTKAEDPMTPSLGLIKFKERFDSRGILRSTYHLSL
jgi:hypothetical protein